MRFLLLLLLAVILVTVFGAPATTVAPKKAAKKAAKKAIDSYENYDYGSDDDYELKSKEEKAVSGKPKKSNSYEDYDGEDTTDSYDDVEEEYEY